MWCRSCKAAGRKDLGGAGSHSYCLLHFIPHLLSFLGQDVLTPLWFDNCCACLPLRVHNNTKGSP